MIPVELCKDTLQCNADTFSVRILIVYASVDLQNPRLKTILWTNSVFPAKLLIYTCACANHATKSHIYLQSFVCNMTVWSSSHSEKNRLPATFSHAGGICPLPFSEKSIIYLRTNVLHGPIMCCNLWNSLKYIQQKILILRQRSLIKHCLLRFLCLNIKMINCLCYKAVQRLQHEIWSC